MIRISKYLDPQLIVFLSAETRDEALVELIHALQKEGKIKNKEEFYRAIIDREKIVSTGIGMGVAIPHAKLSHYDDFFISIGILNKGIDWAAVDGTPVRMIFMIGGPDDKQTEYLQILSSLTMALKDEERRKTVLMSDSPAAVIKAFKGF